MYVHEYEHAERPGGMSGIALGCAPVEPQHGLLA